MTQNTYVMAIMADPDVRESRVSDNKWLFRARSIFVNQLLTENQTIRMNIKLARDKFEELASAG